MYVTIRQLVGTNKIIQAHLAEPDRVWHCELCNNYTAIYITDSFSQECDSALSQFVGTNVHPEVGTSFYSVSCATY